MNSKVLSVGACAVCLLGAGCALRTAKTPTRPEIAVYRPLSPSRNDIVGDWLAMTEDYLYIYRLSLCPDGTGTLAYSFASDLPQVLPVTNWRLEARKIVVPVDP